MRRGDWKLIVNKGGKAMLFNLADDPYEKHDVAKERTEQVEELTKLLVAHQSLDEPKIPADLAGFPH